MGFGLCVPWTWTRLTGDLCSSCRRWKLSLLWDLELPWNFAWDVVVVCSSTPIAENTSVFNLIKSTMSDDGLNSVETMNLFDHCFE